jgi:glycosyltransferase involved in cell wall biosynthesis
MIAPPWIPVPPPGYGGIEAVIALLCEELIARGHQVTLFAPPESRSRAQVRALLDAAHPEAIGSAMHESDHVACAWDEIDRAAELGHPFDVIHDHCGFTGLAMACRMSVPVVHTLHGPFTDDTARFYERHGHKCRLVAISESQLSQAPHGARPVAVVPNPIVVGDWPLVTDKHGYLLWMGRMDPVKGAHHAIAAARHSGRRLVLAGPVQCGQDAYFREQVEPHIDGREIVFAGEVGGTPRKQLFAQAMALLMPIRWAEPFGMVMVEALACGTPVITFPEGAASEIVIDGENGYHVDDELQMAEAIGHLDEIDPLRCRSSVEERYGVGSVADRYESVYESALRAARGLPVPLERGAPAARAERPAATAARLGAERALQRAG